MNSETKKIYELKIEERIKKIIEYNKNQFNYMISFNSEVEKNTKLFFEELNKENCDPKILYEISLKNIYLYEPLFKYDNIRYHEYVVDISLKNKQFFIIYNEKQYNRFLALKEKYENEKFNGERMFQLIIKNKYFISKLVEDDFVGIIAREKYQDSKYNLTILLYYLYKYDFISYNIFDLFKSDDLNLYTIVYIIFHDMFYLNESINLSNITKYINLNILILEICDFFGRDINVLNYIIKNIISGSDGFECFNMFRILPFFPIDILKKYSTKLFKPNILYFKHENKYLENLFNIICSNEILYDIYKSFIKQFYFIDYIEKYNIPNISNDFKILNIDKYIEAKYVKKVDICYDEIKYNDLWFGNKDLFRINDELKNYYEFYDDPYAYSYKEIQSLCKVFKQNYLNDIDLMNILKNPDYIIQKSKNDLSIQKNFFINILVKCCIIGSLIYNNKSKFIISVLVGVLNENYKDYTMFFYDCQYNALFFGYYKKITYNEAWELNFSELLYYTLTSTSNDKFNTIFNCKSINFR